MAYYGSSPWARGTLVQNGVLNVNTRFIPVGTGNTPVGKSEDYTFTVHPRGHGEHINKPATYCRKSGSSPWARGTQRSAKRYTSVTRFIPVGTGNTSTTRAHWRGGSVHPRGHGEHFVSNENHAAFSGSSPWARGTRFVA